MLKKIWKKILGINNNHQYLFWYRYKNSLFQNFGDLVGPELLENISNISVKHIDDKPIIISSKHIPHYLTVGSIISMARKSSIIWGSGIIDQQHGINKDATYLAVRGPLSQKRIIELGGTCPEIYGDPALLLPILYPSIPKKENSITIIPHYVDYQLVSESLQRTKDIDIIQMMTDDFQKTLYDIASSNFIISSSLHGLIIAIAYEIPCLWVEFSNKIYGDDIKFYDFFESLGINSAKKIISTPKDILKFQKKYQPIVAKKNMILERQIDLIKSYPFTIKNENIIKLQKNLKIEF